MKTISILMTSDTHGYWLGGETNNLLQTAQGLKQLKLTKDHPTLMIDLGDFIQGSSFATYMYKIQGSGQFFAKAMNAIGYDYQIIGNHEFNYGADYRQAVFADLKAPILNSNMVNTSDGQPFVGQPYAIHEIDGIKIGIIGATTHYIPNWELPEHYQGITFKDAFQTVKEYAELLRPQVDVLIVAYHGGFESDLTDFSPLERHTGENQGARMLQEIEGIDLLLTGHQHRHINQKVGNTWVVQAGYGGEYIADITLTLDDDHPVDTVGQLHATADFPEDASLKAYLAADLDAGNSWLQTVIGHAPLKPVTSNTFEARVGGHPFIEMLNQIQLIETGAQFSAIALINDNFAAFTGDITNETLLLSYPYYNRIARVNITGNALREVIEYDLEYLVLNEHDLITVNPKYIEPKPRHYNFDIYSGLQVTVDLRQAFGQRIVALVDEATGNDIVDGDMYSIALSQYRAAGGGDFKQFNVDKIAYLSDNDVASLLGDAVAGTLALNWEAINANYQHWVYQPPFKPTLD
ncbi:bifunctional metallophosphatase/5'-nucleotidase [Fundicoccus culcitae]|uniref:Bifunctional metallophosphatase/5'-nucleotidase n=1 Tax=Fundicoccus culcitae TaxID=2969821 RepID=A0ABY5PAA1_9LACT|nr:bifunctional UDP-sugar hydrolase/5'-nucleotidase [Fundicoccus culcitae]UUX35323.1 bifunctional metallophosphatase/5'-nucleotidase [Fundicoccus culcitae]